MKNIGTADKILRLIIGVVLIVLGFTGPQISWWWIGFIPIITALINFCPAYKIFGIKTCGCCGGSCETKAEG